MKKYLSAFVLAALASFGAALIPPATAASADRASSTPRAANERRRNVHHDTSVPLSQITPAAVQAPRPEGADTGLPIATPTGAPDPVVQSSQIGLAIPTTSTNFDGIGHGINGFTVTSAPPDTNGAVGPNHYVQTVNNAFAIFDKTTGAMVYGPVPINTLWSGFGGGCQTNNDGDAIVNYDRISDRWVISQFSVSTTPFLQCVAVSQTPDPTGAYFRYSFQYTNFPDYPKMAVWPDAYYETFNTFTGGTTYAGAEVCAYDRTKMLTGAAATQQCFTTSTSFGGLLASDLDGSTLPPAGSENYVISLGASANQLATWKFHIDWTTPANSTFAGPTSLATAPFSALCGGGTCVPQSGTTQKLDSLADRLMFRFAYRNFGDHEALVVTHSVTAGTGGGVRWYELRPSAGNLAIFQQGTYAPDANYRWMSSAAMDQSGDIGVGFSRSGSTTKPSISYTGRLAGDALGTLPQGEGTLVNGSGSQLTNLSRWGDYSAMTVDPVDDCTFWYTNEYLKANGTFNWSTRIGSFKFPSCGPVVANDFSISASPALSNVTQGGSTTSAISTAITNGAAQTIALSAGGLPAGVTASFSPNTVSAGGSSTLTLTASGGAAVGTSTVVVTGTGTSATHTTSVSLTVAAASVDPVSNGGFELGSLSGWVPTGTASAAVGGHSGVLAAQLSAATPTAGDSSVAQTFTVPPSGGRVYFWYKVVCPDVVANDWATALLRDNTTSVTTTALAKKCSNTGSWMKASKPVVGGHSYTLTLASHDNNVAGTATSTFYDDVAVVYNPVVNPGFESGDLTSWTPLGTASVVAGGHAGSFAAEAGSTGAPTNGDSSVSQTFTLPSGATTLSFFYKMTCPDTVAHDWVTATLVDHSANTTKTILAKKCVTNSAFVKASTTIKTLTGHNVTLTLTSHDDNGGADPSSTRFDDINLT